MKKLVLFCFAACFCAVASAQKVYFLYLQSDDQTPFYVKMGDKIHSSAASGYLILPNLTDGNYSFGLGFAKSNSTEAKFSVNINQNDKGYIIKNFDDGLSLFDVHDLSLIKANAIPQDNTAYETKTDRFSTILSKAANDPGLLKVPVAKKEEPARPNTVEKEPVLTAKVEETKPPEQQPAVDTSANLPLTETAKSAPTNTEESQKEMFKNPAVVKDTATSQDVATGIKEPEVQAIPQTEKKEEVADVQTAVYKPSVISRYSESSTTEGFGIIYFDTKDNGTDTIRILIPAPRVKLVADTETASATPEEKPQETQPEPKTEDTAQVKTNELRSPLTENTTSVTVTSPTNCKSIASDKDFLNLRKKMAAKNSDDDMLDEARKSFRSKCYSVEQVRYLSTLFLTSASKYRFFDAAYEYVSDKNNFASLGSEIKDEHYGKRFKAMVGE